jgi:hypothetical protein
MYFQKRGALREPMKASMWVRERKINDVVD